MPGADRPLGSADFQCRFRLSLDRLYGVGVAVKSVLAAVLAGLNLDQTDIEPGTTIAACAPALDSILTCMNLIPAVV
jgi:hypothetical protein